MGNHKFLEIKTEEDALRVILYDTFGKKDIDYFQFNYYIFWIIGIVKSFIGYLLGISFIGFYWLAFYLSGIISMAGRNEIIGIGIFIHIAGIIFILASMQFLRSILIFNSFRKYFVSKSSLIKDSMLLEGMKNNGGNLLDHIEMTRKVVLKTTNINTLLLESIGIIQRDKLKLSLDTQEILMEFFKREYEWYITYSNVFQVQLKLCLDNQKKALSEYKEKNLDSKKIESLQLLSTRFSSHIENLEKVRVRL